MARICNLKIIFNETFQKRFDFLGMKMALVVVKSVVLLSVTFS